MTLIHNSAVAEMTIRKTLWNALLIASIGCTLTACATQKNVINNANEVERVRLAAEQWKTYYEADDYDSLMTLYTDNPRVYLHGQPGLVGMQAVKDYFKPRMGIAKAKFELDYETIEVTGDLAILVSKYWLTIQTDKPSEPFRDQGRSLLIYKKDASGDWKIAFDIDQASPDVDWIRKELRQKTF